MTSPTPRAQPRARYIVAALVCIGAVIAVVILAFALSGNVVYFRTVSEATQARDDDGRFRIAGAVVPGSVKTTDEGVAFEVTDGQETLSVIHKGDTPQLFEDGAPVVCEGKWGRGDAFASDRIMIKHGEDYTPPKVNAGERGA